MLILPLAADEHLAIDRGLEGLTELKSRRLCWHDDDVDTEPMSLHEFEKFLFSRLCKVIKFPFGDDAYQACLNWHR